MPLVDQALHTLTDWFFIAMGLLSGILGLIDNAMQRALAGLAVPTELRRVVVMVVDLLLLVAVVRVFGGVIRVLLVVFLLLLLVHVTVPGHGP